MRLKGKLLNWDEEKAFGFIAPNGGGAHVFIHKTAFYNRKRTPQVNDIITFSISKDKQGRYCADAATFSGEKIRKRKAKRVNQFSLYLAVLFLGGLIILYFMSYIPRNVGLVYVVMSVVTFLAYASDKYKARRGESHSRTPESTLHFLALLGGWPGAAIAQEILRHKSKKREFRQGFWFTVVVNCAALTWLISVHGKHILEYFT